MVYYANVMTDKAYRIIVSLDIRHEASREVLSGILRYAASHPEWDIQLRGNHPSNDGFLFDAGWQPDGLVIDDVSARGAGIKLLSCRTLRGAVFVNMLPPPSFGAPCATLPTDDAAIGAAAARLFNRRGLMHYAFVGSRGGERWSEGRCLGFRRALADLGLPSSAFLPPPAPQRRWKSEFAALAKWISALPKPCGVLAAFDQRARHVVEVCRRIGVHVPEQVQVLGVDDENYICEYAIPSISSIAPDFSGGGHAAAAALHAILSGRDTRRNVGIKIGVAGITERMSTTDMTAAGSRVTRACDFIRRRACDGISVPAVVRAVGGSERLLEKNFRTVLGHSICREIQDRRLAEVQRLLRETALPIGTIAERCGFGSGNYLKNLFRARFGRPMSTCRS